MELLSFINLNQVKNVQVFYKPKLGPHQAILFGLNQMPSSIRYVCFSGDDDYHLPSGLDSAASLLDTNEKAVTAAGKAFIGLSPFGYAPPQIKFLERYWRKIQLDDSNFFQRVRDHISHYHNWEFGLTRIETYKSALALVLDHFGDQDFLQSRMSEYAFSLLIPVHGQVLWTNVPFVLRTDHPSRPNRLTNPINSDDGMALLAQETVEVLKSAGTAIDHLQLQYLHKQIRSHRKKPSSRSVTNKRNVYHFSMLLAHKVTWHIDSFIRAKWNSQWFRLIEKK